MKKTISKEKVYEYLIEGWAQTKIAELLKVSRQRINKITNELEKEDYIRCVNPKGNPKLYAGTNKPYIKKGSHIGPNNRPFERCRVHNCSYVYRMVVSPLEPVKWDSKSLLRNGVFQYILKYPFKDVGTVTFKRIKGKEEDKLIIWIPDEIWMTREQLKDYKSIILGYCQQCANWFMKRYYCILEPIGLHQKPHFAIVDTPEAHVLSRFGNFSVSGSVWVDCSTGIPEWETDFVDYAIIRADMPRIIYSVSAENIKLKDEIKRLKDNT